MGKRRLGKKRTSSSAASSASSASCGGAGEPLAAGTVVAAGVLVAKPEITVRPVAADPAPPSAEPASRSSDGQKRQKRWEDDDGGGTRPFLRPAPGTPSQKYEFHAPRYHDFTTATPNAFALPACLSLGAQRSDTHDGTPLDPAKVQFRDRESLSADNSSVFSDGGTPSFLDSGSEEGAHSDGDVGDDAWVAECTVPTKGESESEDEDGDDDDGSRTVIGRITSPTTRLPDVEEETAGWRARSVSCLGTDVSAEIPSLESGGEPAATQRSTGPKDGTPSSSLSIKAARSTGSKDGTPFRSLSIAAPKVYGVASISSPPQRVPVGQVWEGDIHAGGTGRGGAQTSQRLSNIHSSGVTSERKPRCGSSVAEAYASKTTPARTSKKDAPSQLTFATDRRLRRGRQQGDEDLALLRRKAGTSRGITKRKSKKANFEVLKPLTFHRSERSRLRFRTADGDDDGKVGSPFVPLAVKVKEFDKTPDRFKSRPTRKAANKALQRIILNTGPTQPKSPKFATKARAKPSRFEPTEERLAREAKFAANSFKAKPINYRIFESHGDLGVPKIAKPQLTAPISPRFSKRPDPRHFVESDIVPAATTVRANPVPHEVLDKPFRPVISHRRIKPEPFTLVGESVRAARLKEKQELLRRLKEQEENSRRFKANPLPDFSEALAKKTAEKKKARDRPAPAPFHFRTDLRGEAYQARLRKQLDDERALREKENKFSAQVAPLATKTPFVPKRSSKKLTATEDVTLQTDVRAEERRRLAEQQREKEREEERIREETRVVDEKRAREELRRFRKDLVHHAQPVRNFARVRIHPSGKALTQAKSPLIGCKRRAAKETSEQEWTEADGGGPLGEQWQEEEGRAM